MENVSIDGQDLHHDRGLERMRKEIMRKALMTLFAMVLLLAAATAAAHAVYGKIGEKYNKLGGAAGALGPAVSDEADAPYGGRLQYFKEGTIWWHPSIGDAFAVQGAINVKYFQVGRTEFGYPITDELTTPDGRGRYNHFRAVQEPGMPEASIYWTPETGAHEVQGLIRDAWAKGGWERGELGYPTSDEFQDGPNRRSNFEHGYILWSQQDGIRVNKAGAVIIAKVPPRTFLPLLVNGMEIAAKDRVLASDPLFLSENIVCGAWNAHLGELDDYVKSRAIAAVNALIAAKLHRTDFGIRTSGTHVNFSNACSFRADVLQACQSSVGLHLFLPDNSFEVYVMTPYTAKDGVFGDSDPKFSVHADLDITTSVLIPGSSSGPVGLGSMNVRLLNVKFDSHNVTGDLVKDAVEVGSKYFMGQNIIDTLSEDRVFKLDAISISLDTLTSAARSIPPNYHLDACLRDPDIFRVTGTDVPDQGPVVK